VSVCAGPIPFAREGHGKMTELFAWPASIDIADL
jgi:hypothetical protein